jgi:hypothetical protein
MANKYDYLNKLYDIILPKSRKGRAEIVGYEQDGFVVLLDFGDGRIIKKLACQGVINGSTFMPFDEDFKLPALKSLDDNPEAGKGLHGKIAPLKRIEGGIFGVFDVEGTEYMALLEDYQHDTVKIGTGTFKAQRNPWIVEPPEEKIVTATPLWFGPIIFADGRKLGSRVTKEHDLRNVHYDGGYHYTLSGSARGFPFVERIFTLPTEEDKLYSGSFRVITSYYYSSGPTEVTTTDIPDEEVYKPLANNLQTAISIFPGTSWNIDDVNRLIIFQSTAYWHEGIGAHEYFLPDYYQFNSGGHWLNFGRTSFVDPILSPSRRIINYDKTNQKYHTSELVFLPWILRARCEEVLNNYTYTGNIWWYFEQDGNYWNPSIKFYGGFLVDSIEIDVTGFNAKLTGSMQWLDEPLETNVDDELYYENFFNDFAVSHSSPSITYVNDNLPESDLIILDEDGAVVDTKSITPGAFSQSCVYSVLNDYYSYKDIGSLYTKYLRRTEGSTSSYGLSDFWENITFPITRMDCGVGINRYRPAYCIDIPDRFNPIKTADNSIYSLWFGDETDVSGNGFFIPHIEWLDKNNKTNGVQSPFPPETNIEKKPQLNEINLKKSAVRLPSGWNNWKGFKIYQKPNNKLSGVKHGSHSENFSNFPSDGVYTSQGYLTKTHELKFINWDFDVFKHNDNTIVEDQIIEAWAVSGGIVENFLDSNNKFKITDYLVPDTNGTTLPLEIDPYINVPSSEPKPAKPDYWKIKLYKQTSSISYELLDTCYSIGTITIKRADGTTRETTEYLTGPGYPYIRIPAVEGDISLTDNGNYWYQPSFEFNFTRMNANVALRIGGFMDIYWKTGDIETATQYGLSNHLSSAGLAAYGSGSCSMDGRITLIPIPNFGTDTTTSFPNVDDPIVSQVYSNRPRWGPPSNVAGWLLWTNNEELGPYFTWIEQPYIEQDTIWTIPIEFHGVDIETQDEEIFETHSMDETIVQNDFEFLLRENYNYVVVNGSPKLLRMGFHLPIIKSSKLMLHHDMNARIINPNKLYYNGEYTETTILEE